MDKKVTVKRGAADYILIVLRVFILLMVCSMFFAAFNPTYIFTVVDGNRTTNTTSLFTAAITSGGIRNANIEVGIAKGFLDSSSFGILRAGSIFIFLGIIAAGAGACVSLGSKHMKRLATLIITGGAIFILIGALMINSFVGNVEKKTILIDEESQSQGSYDVVLANETDKTTKMPEGHKATDANVFNVKINNNSGKSITGWALKIKADEGASADSVIYINKWVSIRVVKDLESYKYNVAFEDGYLYISPDNYVVKDGQLVQDETLGESGEFSTIAAGDLILTLICDGISENSEISVYDGKVDNPIEWKYPGVLTAYFIACALLVVLSIAVFFTLGHLDPREGYYIDSQYQLFLMFLPFLLLIAAFSYLPLYGWRYAFYDDLEFREFAGLKYFKLLFQNGAYIKQFMIVMRNTLVMSALGLATSWLPMVFAIFLNELRSNKFKKFVTTFSTIPNFISWVLVYAIAFPIFTSDGLFNQIFGGIQDHLAESGFLWIKMLLWGTWKGVGWSAIIYISGIAGIDQQLYEAASIDGADRFQRMWHITLPGLLPTYVVMLVMSIAGILSNGMDQYLVFSNPQTEEALNVLDLYVYNLGIVDNQIPFSTVVGMGKSIVSIILFFAANSAAKAIRGDGIV